MMQKIKQLIQTRPYVSIAILVGIIALVGILVLLGSGNGEEQFVTPASRTVQTISVSEYASGAVGFFAPTASGNSFVIRAETGGRVDQTNVSNGISINTGAILVRLDGDAQLASLTQAEGVYESALASAQQSGVSVDGSQKSLISSYRSAYTTANDVLLTTLDTFFVAPTQRTRQTPGLKINGGIDTQYLNDERVAFRSIMEDWNKKSATASAEDNLHAFAEEAVRRMQRMVKMIDTFVVLVNKQDFGTTIDGVAVESYLPTLSTERSLLVSAISALQTADENLKKAELNSTGTEVSSANAQVKQALGALQAARSAYEKTIIRAPFSGVVSSLNVSVGDIVGTGSDIVVITPEDTADTDQSFSLPLSSVKYTPTGTFVFSLSAEGIIESVEVEAGLVTTNSVIVTGLTGNEVIVEDVRGLKAGDKVTNQ